MWGNDDIFTQVRKRNDNKGIEERTCQLKRK